MVARTVAWVVVGITTVCVVLDTAFTAAHRSLLSEETWALHGWPLGTFATLGSALMGALVIGRYPRNPIGWLLLVPCTAAISLAAEAYSVWVLDGGGPGSDLAGHVSGWVSVLVGGHLAVAALILVFLISPDGHLPSRRWRWAVVASLSGAVAFIASVFTLSPSEFVVTEEWEDTALTLLLQVTGIVLLTTALIASAVSVVIRLRRARDDERRQLLWVASSATFLAFGFAFSLVVSIIQGGEATWLARTPLFAAYLAFPICIAVAVLRHRMFDIDLIVNRALVVALATGLVAAGYVFIVVVVGSAVGGDTGSFWRSLLATALVAMAFQPVRRRVVQVADRLAFGAAAAPYEALADFSRRVGESPDPARLLPALADAAGAAVNARRVTVRLSVPGAPDHVATWPPEVEGSTVGPAVEGSTAGPEVEVVVADRGESLGTITVEMPAGRALRTGDSRLLQDLADQAAIALRNARLSAELSNRVEQLDRRTLELAESRRRLITAGDAERSRLERSIAHEVVPHLEALPARLTELAGAGNGALQTSQLQPLVAASTAALEALREITRGVFPAQLTRSGLASALGSLLGRAGDARLSVDASATGRLDPQVEAAAYFCVAEAARDLRAPIEVALTAPAGDLLLVVSGSDRGTLVPAQMRDRVEAAGGSVDLTTEAGRTLVEVRLPLRTAQPVAAPQ